jgi:hypothetical protein
MGDRQRVLDLCRGASDAQRRAVGPVLREQFFVLAGPHPVSATAQERRAAYQLTRLAIDLEPADAFWALISLGTAPLEEQLEALEPRSTRWKRRFAAAALSHEAGRDRSDGRGWQITYTWVQAGVIDAPASQQWILGMLDRHSWDALSSVGLPAPVVEGVLSMLLDRPGVARALGRRAREDGGAWRALLQACGGFDIERRDAVVDACISGLVTAATPMEATGFVALLDHLDLQVGELAHWQGRCAALLLAPTAPAIAWGATSLRRVLDGGTLNADTVLDVTTEVLQGPTKARIRDHLRFLDDAVTRDVLAAEAAAAAATTSLDADRSDVALLLAGSLARWSSALDDGQIDDLRALVEAALPHPWPELRGALGALAPQPAKPVSVPALGSAPVDLGESGTVDPVAGFDELIVLMEEVLSLGPSVVELERALDGLSRLRLEDAPPQTRTRALRALQRWGSSGPGRDLVEVLDAWRGLPTPPLWAGRPRYGMSPLDSELPPGVIEYVDQSQPYRCWAVVEPAYDPGVLTSRRLGLIRTHHFSGPSAPLLSTPTSQDGTLGVDDVLRRARDRAARGLDSELYDTAWALLRLRPADRKALLASGVLSVENATRLRLVARPADWKVTVLTNQFGWTSALWHDAAAAAETGSLKDPVRAWLNPATATTPHRAGEADWNTASAGSLVPPVTMWASTISSHPDVLAAHLQYDVFEALHGRAWDAMELLMPAIGAVRVPWSRPSAWAVVTGMSVQSTTARVMAAEAVAAGVRAGMLEADVLTRGLLDALGDGPGPHRAGTDGGERAPGPKMTRISAGLADAARIHDRAADVVLRALLHALPDLLNKPGVHTLVGVAAQLAERLGRRAEIPSALVDLAASRSRTRTAEEARRLVAST